MPHQGFRSSITTQGRRMAGARSLWRASMQEMLYPTSYIKSKHLGTKCALLTDGRFSGHVSPEAAEGGAIALLEEGDIIRIDIPERSINVLLADDELAARRKKMEARGRDAYTPTERKVSAALQAYAALTTSADRGAVRDIRGPGPQIAPSQVPA